MKDLWKRTTRTFTAVHFLTCRHLLVLGQALVLAVLLAACSSASSGSRTIHNAGAGSRPEASGVDIVPLPRVTLTAYDDFFAMPRTMAAGLTDVTLVNAGAQPHQAVFGRLKPGVIPGQVLAAAKRGLAAEPYLFSVLDFTGGPNAIAPGGRMETILNLRAGHYVALCFVPGPDGRPHYQLGMITPFDVTTISGQPSAGEPRANVMVKLVDFGFVMPATLRHGELVQVVNQGKEVHEMAIVRLAPGKTLQDILAWAKKPGPSLPFVFEGGMAELSPGSTGWLRLSLPPGQYVSLCFVPDPVTDKPHYMLGMIAPLTVQTSSPLRTGLNSSRSSAGIQHS